MLLNLEGSRSATCLELEIECFKRATQGCALPNKLETASLENVPLTEDLMQTEVLKGTRDFGTKDFVALKEKGLVFSR